jgi:2-polyprenyl-6-methoxyphenol hydroxylase-like FAD-dependent oxidoreductase
MKQRARVIIVGAGPVGLTMGLGLAQHQTIAGKFAARHGTWYLIRPMDTSPHEACNFP